MHCALSCYLQCTLWGGEMQQALSQEVNCCPWQSSHIRHPGCASGADPRQKAPCQGQPEALANTKGGQRAGDAPRTGTPSTRCTWHCCIWPCVRQIVSCFAWLLQPVGPWSSCCCPGQIQKSLRLVPPDEWPPWHGSGARSRVPVDSTGIQLAQRLPKRTE